MDCREIKKYLEDYILEELDPTIEIQINAHLAECEQCRKDSEEKQKLINAFRESHRFAPPLDTYKRIRSSIYVPRKEKRFVWGFPKSFVFATAAFLLGIVLMRTVDVFIFSLQERQKVEVRFEPLQRAPFSDTVQFYTVPVKNLARI